MSDPAAPGSERGGTRATLRRGVLALLALGVLGALVVVSGVLPITASSGHWAITSWFLHFAMQRSVATHSIGIEVPELDDPRLVLMGAGHYEGGCKFCHAAPGWRLPRVTHASTPHAPRLTAEALSAFDDAELFYIVLHGVKFTGMPAWPALQREDEVWAVVAFLRKLPELTPEAYRSLVYGGPELYDDAAPELVNERCARCHGAHGLGRGEGAFPVLAGQRLLYLQLTLEAYARGERHSGIMEPIAAWLDSEDMAAIARWYASRPPPPARAPRADAELPGERIPLCTACHGGQGVDPHPAFPRLAGQYPAYLEQQLQLLSKEQRGGTRYVALMHTVADWLDDDELAPLARYFGRRVPAEREPSEDTER